MRRNTTLPWPTGRSLILSLVLTAAAFGLAFAPSLHAQEGGAGVAAEVRRLDAELRARAAREDELMRRLAKVERTMAEEGARKDAEIAALRGELGRGALEGRIEAIQAELAAGTIDLAGGAREERDLLPLRFGGYFDLEFRHDEASDDTTFDQHRLILQIEAEILPRRISFRTEIEIEGGGTADFLSDNEIAVEYAELRFHLDRAFNLKFGALLIPFGRFNLLHDSPLRDLTDRPLVDRRIIPTTWTDAGVGAYGAFDLGDAVTLDYDIVVVNGLDGDFSSTAGGGFRDARGSFREDVNDDKMIVGRLGVTPHLGFLDHASIGLSFGFGRYDEGDDRSMRMFALDWTFREGPFEFIGEYACVDLERGAAEVAAGVPGGASGYYLQLNYHFFVDSWVGTTPFFTEESTFTLVVRYGTIDTDDSALGIDRDSRGAGFRDDLRRVTFGINFRPVEKTVIKLEYQWFPEFDGIDEVGNDRIVLSVASYF
ncbi:MAG: hypothetical protein R3F20_10520 [Planctomycetota bacterium]